MSAQHRVAAHTRWALTADRSEATRKARAAFDARFVDQARRLHPTAPENVVALVADSLRRAHFSRMALARHRGTFANNQPKETP